MFPKNTRFLVVDDFSTMRKIVIKILAELGYLNVEEADDGETALSLLKKAAADGQPFEFIISDWNMPKMLGIELLIACKADPCLKLIPFMLVTAESEQKQILEAARAGVSEYVVKPFNATTLKYKLEKIYIRIYPPQALKAS